MNMVSFITAALLLQGQPIKENKQQTPSFQLERVALPGREGEVPDVLVFDSVE